MEQYQELVNRLRNPQSTISTVNFHDPLVQASGVGPVRPQVSQDPAVKKAAMKNDLGAFFKAMKQQESGNYRARNSMSGAMGAYQIMPGNIPAWSKEALGRSITPKQFINSPSLQEQIAQYKLGKYVKKYGMEGAASAWYSGNPNAYKTSHHKQKGNYPAVSAYVKSVMRKLAAIQGRS